MKRIVIAILLLAICLSSLFVLSSCGKKNAGSTVVLFSDEGLLCVERNDKRGYINKEGQEVIPCKYYYATSFFNGCAIVKEKKDDPYYYIKPDGTRLLDTPFYEAEAFDSKDRAVVKKSEKGKYELIDKKGKSYLTAETIYSGDNGLYRFKDESGMWGIVDKNGKTIIEAKYDGVWFVREYYGEYYRDSSYYSALTDRFNAYRKSSSGDIEYLIDSKGNELYTTKPEGELYGFCVDKTIPVYEDDGLLLLDYNGREIKRIAGAWDIEGVFSGGLLCELDDDEIDRYPEAMDGCLLIDWKGNILFDARGKDYEPDDMNWNGDLIFYTEDEKCGIIDAKKGEVLINPEYAWLSDEGFDVNGLCIGQKEENGSYIAINRKGKTVFSKNCDWLEYFEDNPNAPYYIACYKQGVNNSYELIDAKGETVHTFGIEYRPWDYYDDGFFVCTKIEDGKCVGEVVFNSKFEQITSIVYDEIIQ